MTTAEFASLINKSESTARRYCGTQWQTELLTEDKPLQANQPGKFRLSWAENSARWVRNVEAVRV